ncbi:ureidoglycolate lyase [Candidatus Phycosocius bacilliformis]|uniref:Ureidoglycolate lyase n=1 Tax=Candidatus Phycosocius bacilliformis TaxID=1445552 RepID=A0A2P2E9U7_9PROT|nr:fumarylacetoacetate hydrolase family protein [Candidatus Phycosocius bacilliformis]GBF57835.1 ureidoglycolate lyase [Candidatus Phycosocius bacilliformis]
MKLATILYKDVQRIAQIEGKVAQLLAAPADGLGVVSALRGPAEGRAVSEEVPLQDIQFLAPVPQPPRIFGIGLNYADHAAETGREPPAIQTWFMKQMTAVNAPYGDVEKPVVSDKLDFEVELVVVIGAKARHVPVERAGDVIAGYCVGCDYSVRDWQRATPTMIMGKGFDTHAPFGPYLVTPDEIDNLDALRLRCFVNDQLMQDGCVADLIFKVPEMIHHLSTAFTLLPGDIIFTGTPAGVGIARTPPRFLFAGDRVRCEIDGLGHIDNRIVDEVKATLIA